MNAIASSTDLPIRGSPPTGRVGGDPQNARPAAASTPAPTPPEAPSEPRPEALKKAAEGVNAFLKSSGSHIQFAVHEGTHRMMVEVVDDSTQEVVRTIPSKDVLDLAAKIDEMVGLLLDRRG